MKIIDRLPYFDTYTTAQVRGEAVRVRPFQIVVWASITPRELAEWDPRVPGFPAILDTGHNHHFSIRRSHLVHWAGLQPGALHSRRSIRELGLRVPLHASALWLHPNTPGKTKPSGAAPRRLSVDDGIAVYPDDVGPRLPLLGLRAVTENELSLLIDGRRQMLSVRTPDWRSRLLAWLA